MTPQQPTGFMKHKTQDPKFYIEDNRLVGQSGLVPDDEPLFILRARDINAVDTLCHYLALAAKSGCDKEHGAAVARRIVDFGQFRINNPQRMKVPDTDISQLHSGTP